MAGEADSGASRAASQDRQAAVAHAMSFGTWRSLCVDLGLSNASAVDLMVAMTAAAATGASDVPADRRVGRRDSLASPPATGTAAPEGRHALSSRCRPGATT